MGRCVSEILQPEQRGYQNAGGWSLAADMYLTADKAHVYAYYPYSATATDGTKVAVQAATTDYMWEK